MMKCDVISVGTEQQNTVKQTQLNDLVASDFKVCTPTTVLAKTLLTKHD